MEVAAVESKELKVPNPDSQASGGKILFASPPQTPTTAICLSCGKSDHARRDCRFSTVTCHT